MYKREKGRRSAVRSGVLLPRVQVSSLKVLYLHAQSKHQRQFSCSCSCAMQKASSPTNQPTHSLLKFDSLALLLPPSPLSASPPAVVGESTNVSPRTSVSPAIGARAADGVVSAHGATTREITAVDREFGRKGQVRTSQRTVRHCRRWRDGCERLGVGRADARAVATVASGTAWRRVGFEAAGRHR